jgi:hypothetical protein
MNILRIGVRDMSDVIETLDKNIKTLEMLEKEYAKRATKRINEQLEIFAYTE